MSKPLLSIIISSQNRSDLLIHNLNLMLQCRSPDIEFIVCDNCSTDDTWSKLCQIEDARLIKKKNVHDYGFENFWMVSFGVQAKYFMFINDRDHMECSDMEWLCEQLRRIETVDFISCDRGRYEVGYYSWEDAITLYFQSRHPGTLIYNTAFCHRILDGQVFEKYLLEDRPKIANNYLVFQLLLNVTKVYACSRFFIVQPVNREAVKKVRKEYYGCVYISLEYRKSEYYDWLAYAEKYKANIRTKFILEAIYKDSFRTITKEYYFSLQKPGFKERNDCEELKLRQWFANGVRFCMEFCKTPLLPYPDMQNFIIFTSLIETLRTFKAISLDKMARVRRFCKKEFCRL